LRLIGDDPHVQGTQKYSALRRGEEYEGRPLRGEGLTAAEIASPPGIGAWTEGKDEQSGAEYVETIRRASPRYSW